MYQYDNAIDFLIDKFPELGAVYENDIDYYEGLPYVFYESVFTKYIINRIQDKDISEVKKFFTVIEDFLKNGDEKFKNLIDVAVIESLFHEKDYIEYADKMIQYYGVLTKQSFDECIN